MTLNISQTLQQAVAYHQAGQLPQAEALYQGILTINPNHPDALHLLGLIAQQCGQHQVAANMIRQAIAIHPSAPMFCNLGAALLSLGQMQEAEASLRKALALQPQYADAYSNLGNVILSQGDSLQAMDYFLKAIKINPQHVEALLNLGNAYKDIGKLDEAVDCYHKVLAINPQYADALNNLGVTLHSMGKLDEAIECYRKTLEIRPDYAEAYIDLGTICNALGNPVEAIECYRKALSINPDLTPAYQHMGVSLYTIGRLQEAVDSYRKALITIQDDANIYSNLGAALHDLNQHAEAALQFKEAIRVDPAFAAAHNNLGLAYQAQGMLTDAIASHRKAITIDCDYVEAHSDFIFACDMHPEMSVAKLQQERTEWAKRHTEHLLRRSKYANHPDPAKRLRIGYVSADFRKHSAYYVSASMLSHFDRQQFEVYAYSNSLKEDSHTELIRQGVTEFKDISRLSDEAASELIINDQIDILVDLSGHSGGNRLLVFARKPAPIQITAWGYIGGTGMQAMDVFFADPVVVPPQEKHLYAEQVVYLPNVVCYQPFEPFPAVNDLPALSSGIITFGSFNRRVKITQQTFEVWAKVLLAVPNSRMILKTAELDQQEERDRLLQTFSLLGILPERIVLQGKSSWTEHMAAFNQVDIALDPFPHGGGVTTLEGIMMGVPAVTLRWPTIPGRISAAVLTPLGLTDWIAETPEQYVDIAVKKASDLMALAVLRKQLRKTMTDSLVGNPKAYAQAVEQQYRLLWKQWCSQQ